MFFVVITLIIYCAIVEINLTIETILLPWNLS